MPDMMESINPRQTLSQLSDDLGWLEHYCRQKDGLSRNAGMLRFASALLRNTVGPFLDGYGVKPLHVVVVGGAGCGKSTIVNFLLGQTVAEANPQAGYTRHPTAYVPTGIEFPSSLGFLDSLQRITDQRPANLDEDIYQFRNVAPCSNNDPIAEFVVWDCPDMTTWASSNYAFRLLEVAALADVIVFVASDERYNDEVPTQFLHLLVEAGKTIVVVLTKMRESEVDAISEHFRAEVLSRLPKLADGTMPAIPITAIPFLSEAQRADPSGAGSKHRAALLNQILVITADVTNTRRQSVTNALKYLEAACNHLLAPAQKELAEVETWNRLVQDGQSQFEDRYRREYLSAESIELFDQTRERLLKLLDLPGAGNILSQALQILRYPYQFLRSQFVHVISRPTAIRIPERTVMDAAMMAWFDYLQTETRKRANRHPLWQTLKIGFDAGLLGQAREQYQQLFHAYLAEREQNIDRAAQELLDGLEKNQTLLTTLRVGKFVIDLATIGAVVALSWPPSAWLLLTIPIGVSLTHQFVEMIVHSTVEATRAKVRQERMMLLSQHLSGPMACWLMDWPAKSDTTYQRLAHVIHQVPGLIHQLRFSLEKKLKS